MARTTVWQHKKLPILLEMFKFPLGTINVTAARKELEQMIKIKSDGYSQTWGYFPELKPDPKEYPKVSRFVKDFEKYVLNKYKVLNSTNLRLAFVRRAVSEPISDFGGLHVDVSAGIDHKWDKSNSADKLILRVLFNLDKTPRKVEYYPYTRNQLKTKYDIKIDPRNYKILNMPSYLKSEFTEIPPAADDCVSALIFISSHIPHAGRTDSNGHFLVSYGGYIDRDTTLNIFGRQFVDN